ncbi:hypothetical protein T484DRAFT_1742433 [Baffinella frigidus]|nr:hypothetical protein T484DRAFT_1742433 [Cryptophyta sp. CCMP2293]
MDTLAISIPDVTQSIWRRNDTRDSDVTGLMFTFSSKRRKISRSRPMGAKMRPFVSRFLHEDTSCMIGRTAKIAESGLLLACLIAAAEGATHAGLRAPFRTWTEVVSLQLSSTETSRCRPTGLVCTSQFSLSWDASPSIEDGHDARQSGTKGATRSTTEPSFVHSCMIPKIQRSNSHECMPIQRSTSSCKPIRRSTSHACRLGNIGDRQDVLPSPGIAGGHGSRVLPLRRSTSHARRLSYGAQDDSVYEPVHQRGRKWSPEPVTSPPPLLSDRHTGAHTFIKTKLYPHLPF